MITNIKKISNGPIPLKKFILFSLINNF